MGREDVFAVCGKEDKCTPDHSAILSLRGQIQFYLHLEGLTWKKYDNSISDYIPSIFKSGEIDIL